MSKEKRITPKQLSRAMLFGCKNETWTGKDEDRIFNRLSDCNCNDLKKSGKTLLKIIDEELKEKHYVNIDEEDVNDDWNLNITLTWGEIQAFKNTVRKI